MKSEKERRKNEENIIGVMASRRRAMKELGRITFSPDTDKRKKGAIEK